jgi:hypothetical protein
LAPFWLQAVANKKQECPFPNQQGLLRNNLPREIKNWLPPKKEKSIPSSKAILQ